LAFEMGLGFGIDDIDNCHPYGGLATRAGDLGDLSGCCRHEINPFDIG